MYPLKQYCIRNRCRFLLKCYRYALQVTTSLAIRDLSCLLINYEKPINHLFIQRIFFRTYLAKYRVCNYIASMALSSCKAERASL